MNLLRRPWVQLLLLINITFWVSWKNLGSYYLNDDFAYVGRFHDFPWREWPGLFLHDWSGGIWQSTLPELRPFAALSFMIDAALWGANPLGGHVTNMALHLGCALLVAHLTRLAAPRNGWAPTLAATLFLLNPSHVEPVACINGRVDLIGSLFYLSTVAASLGWLKTGSRWGLALAGLSFCAGCFSKEFVLTAPFMLIGWAATRQLAEWRQLGRRLLILLGVLGGVVLVYWACRRVAFGSTAGTEVTTNIFREEFLWRQVSYLSWLLPPFNGRGTLPAILWPLGLALALGLYPLLRDFFDRLRAPTSHPAPPENHGREILFHGILWYVVATLPLVVTYYSPRHLCLASAGTTIALTLLLANLASIRFLIIALAGVLIVTSAVRTATLATDWMRNGKLSRQIIETLVQTDRERPPGTVILLDLPAAYRDISLWAWALPFANRPPFVEREILDVFEAPVLYVAPSTWREKKQWDRLGTASAAWLLWVDAEQKLRRQVISRAQLQRALPQFRIDLGSIPSEVAWSRFITEATRP